MKLIKNRRINKEHIIFFAILLKMVVQSISMSVIPDMIGQDICRVIFKFMTYSSYIMVIIAFLIDPFYNKSELFLISIIVIISAMGSFFSGNAILLTLIYLYGAKNINIEKIIKNLGICYIFLTLFIILSSQIGIIEDWIFFPNTNRVRWALGYNYPTVTSSVLFTAVLLFCYIKKEHLNCLHIVIIEIINYWVFTKTTSRGGFLLSLLTPVVFFLLKYSKKPTNKSIISWMLQWSFPICAISIFLMTRKFNNQGILKTIDLILSHRLYYSQYSMNKYGVHLFGQKIEWVGWGGFGHTIFKLAGDYNFVDTSYLKLLLENGILVWVMIMLLWTFTCVYAYKHNNVYLLWTLNFLAIYCMAEQFLMNIGANLFVLSLAYPIFGKIHKNKQNKMLNNIRLKILQTS